MHSKVLAGAAIAAGVIALVMMRGGGKPAAQDVQAQPAMVAPNAEPAPEPSEQTAAPSTQQASPDPAAPDGKMTCQQCRETYCRNPRGQGVDLVAGCFEKIDSKWVTEPYPEFLGDCQAAVACAYRTNCAYDPARGVAPCYCGWQKNTDDCVATGPGPDAPCAEEWRRATRSNTHQEVVERFDKILYPSGWAFAMLECDRDFCSPRNNTGVCTP